MEYALSDQQRADYEENGYLIVRDVLPPDETRALREVVEAQAATDAYPPKLHYPEPGKYTVSGNKLALDPVLAAIAEYPAIVERVEALLGQPAYLTAFVAYVRTPGDKGGGAHNDYKRWRPVGSSMNWLFAIVPLTDFDAEYGPLLVSPGSHKLHRVVDPAARILDVTRPDREQLAPFVDPELKAGDLLLLNMYSWHEPPAGTTSKDRCGIFNKYCAVNAPPAAGHYRYDQAAYDALSDEGRRLLAVHSDRPLEETRLLIERPGDEAVFLLQRDADHWQLPGGKGWEEEEGVGWDVGARIGSMQARAREQLGVEIPWMSYIADVEDTCRVYGYLDGNGALAAVDGRCEWFGRGDLQQMLGDDDYICRAIDEWQRDDIVRGMGKACSQTKMQYD
ncbi:MAG: phytanoyl-CoA dioxygenase family protein [Candidatus Latescibacterota bacterium]|nr:phytanoyl-CoA dioxygenase family protein [Candidatus Latescibacterota bacterium]